MNCNSKQTNKQTSFCTNRLGCVLLGAFMRLPFYVIRSVCRKRPPGRRPRQGAHKPGPGRPLRGTQESQGHKLSSCLFHKKLHPLASMCRTCRCRGTPGHHAYAGVKLVKRWGSEVGATAMRCVWRGVGKKGMVRDSPVPARGVSAIRPGPDFFLG